MEPKFTNHQNYMQGLDVVLKGDIRNVCVFDVRIIEEEHRKKTIGTFVACFNHFIHFYGIDEVKKLFM